MDVRDLTAREYDREAGQYESERGHGITTPEEYQAWLDDLTLWTERLSGQQVIDVGTGTGILARLLAEQGCRVEGIDISPGMIEQAREFLPPSLRSRVTFRVGDAHDDLVLAASVDAVVSRQVVCHLDDPLTAFRTWHTWLRPGGIVVVIDGFWSRHGWASSAYADRVQLLPLSSVQTVDTAAYLLTQSGFAIEHRGLLQAVNGYLERDDPEGTDESPRYIVIARKISGPIPTRPHEMASHR